MNIDPKDLISILGSLITWGCFFIAIAMFKRFITLGLAIAFVEILKLQGDETRRKMATWFVNGEDILEHLADEKSRLDAQQTKK